MGDIDLEVGGFVDVGTIPPPFSEWAVVEFMGHRRYAGLLSEHTIAGHGFLRLDVYIEGDTPVVSQLYSPSSVYCITPVAEDVARKVAKGSQPQPVTRWEVPELAPFTREEPF